MEDPWGSPWATADPSPTPKIDLPAAPPSAHFPIENNNTTTSSPRRSIQSPWEEDDAWGGWNESSAAGAVSPSWGRSPGLMPVATSSSSRGVSPDPWKLGEDRRRSSSVEKRNIQAGNDRIGDSAISLGRGLGHTGLYRKPSSEAGLGAQNAWLSPQTALGVEIPVRPTTETHTLPQLSVEAPHASSDEEEEEEDDDEARSPGTKGPSKVQELVDLYDGIAKRSVSPGDPELIEPPLRKLSQNGESIEDVSTDVGVGEKVEERPVTTEKTASSVPESGSDRELEDDEIGSDEMTTDVPKSAPPEATRTLPSRASIQVSVDMSKLDDLFPSVPPGATEPEPVPDVIIDDTFTSISERKAWYRLSRPGSMRMHSLGDDENYVRMDWRRSAARQDTLKIVRRWMEEDSITGRPVLGRKKGAVGASMFNWDSSAPQVEIGELLGRKSEHSRRASSGSKASATSPTVASFGWSSPPSSPTLSIEPPSLAARFKHSAGRANRPQSLVAPPASSAAGELQSPVSSSMSRERPKSLIVPPPDPIVQPSIDQALRQSQELHETGPNGITDEKEHHEKEEGEDEDDWGEMISSPNPPSIAPTEASSRIPDPAFLEPGKPDTSIPVAFEHQVLDEASNKANLSSTQITQNVAADPFSVDSLDLSHPSQPKDLATTNIPEPEPSNIDAPANLDFEWASAIQDSKPTALGSPPFEWSAPSEPAKKHAPTHPIKPEMKPSAETSGRPKSRVSLASGEVVDDETVAKILRSIPDLSYMLR